MRIHAAPEEVGRAGGALVRLMIALDTIEILTSVANGPPLVGSA